MKNKDSRMGTPICDFVGAYCEKKSVRLHMPGHKGKRFLGFEDLDITEIDGADVLYSAHGIIDESQKNAAELSRLQRRSTALKAFRFPMKQMSFSGNGSTAKYPTIN